MVSFAESPRSTVGIEWELALVDIETRELCARAPQILNQVRERYPEKTFPHITGELLTNTIELVTAPHTRVDQAVADLRELVRATIPFAESIGAQLIGAGSHPFSLANDQHFTSTPRYERFAEQYQWWGRNMLIWGAHVHVGIDREDRVVPTMNALLTYLPHMLALSASSPFWGGENTGYSSNRTLLFQQLPSAGLPPEAHTWDELKHHWAMLQATNIIAEPTEARWDIRPAPRWGTLEVRICDSPSSLEEIGMLAAFIQCLTEWAQEQADSGHPLPHLPRWCVQENKWRAARFGLDATIITSENGVEQPLRDSLLALCKQLTPIAQRLECAAELHRIRETLSTGPGAQRQLQLAADAPNNSSAGTHPLSPIVDTLAHTLKRSVGLGN